MKTPGGRSGPSGAWFPGTVNSGAWRVGGSLELAPRRDGTALEVKVAASEAAVLRRVHLVQECRAESLAHRPLLKWVILGCRNYTSGGQACSGIDGKRRNKSRGSPPGLPEHLLVPLRGRRRPRRTGVRRR